MDQVYARLLLYTGVQVYVHLYSPRVVRCSWRTCLYARLLTRRALRYVHNTSANVVDTAARVIFEAEASGGSKAGGIPHPSLSLPSPFPFPLSFQTNQWEGRSDPVRGKFPRLPPLQIPP